MEDRCPQFSKSIDVGSDRYYLGDHAAIELGFKNRKDYEDTFGSVMETECLLRKYFKLGHSDTLHFDSVEDKNAIIKIIKKRINDLKDHMHYNSSTLIHINLQRIHRKLKDLLLELEGKGLSGVETPKERSEVCTKNMEYIKTQIEENDQFQLLLEMSWYLLHPDDVPREIECEWAKIVKQMKTTRIGDLLADIKKAQTTNAQKAMKPLNYFKKIRLSNVLEKKTLKNALDTAKTSALAPNSQAESEKMKERVQSFIKVLAAKKYLSAAITPELITNEHITGMSTKLAPSFMTPMKGGNTKTLDQSLGKAMEPLFAYFKVVYDPIYSLLEAGIKGYLDNTKKEVPLPQLLTLLHICNQLQPIIVPKKDMPKDLHTHGIYRIKNVDPALLEFITYLLFHTATHVQPLVDQNKTTEKNTFVDQVFKLPKVRLSSLITPEGKTATLADVDTLPYLQFFVFDENMSMLKKENMNRKLNEMRWTTDRIADFTSFFTKGDLYLTCNLSKKDIPMNNYEIDYESVDITAPHITTTHPDNYFNEHPELILDELVTLKDAVIYNDAELALSIFIAYKSILP